MYWVHENKLHTFLGRLFFKDKSQGIVISMVSVLALLKVSSKCEHFHILTDKHWEQIAVQIAVLLLTFKFMV